MEYAIELKNEELRFNAMHFVEFQTTPGEWRAEPLHGHDFRVEARIEAPLGDDGCVVDFIAARDSLKEVLAGWNGRVLLPTSSKSASYIASEDTVAIMLSLSKERIQGWGVPHAAVRYLDVTNVSTELIADAILAEWLNRLSLAPKTTVALRLEEAPGCYAVVTARTQ